MSIVLLWNIINIRYIFHSFVINKKKISILWQDIIDNNATLFQKENLNPDTFHPCSATIPALLSRIVLVRKIAYDVSRRRDVGTCATILRWWPRYFLVPLRFRRMRDSEARILVGWRLKGMQFSKPTNHFHFLYSHVTFFPLSSHSSVTSHRLLASLHLPFLVSPNSTENVCCMLNTKLHCLVLIMLSLV